MPLTRRQMGASLAAGIGLDLLRPALAQPDESQAVEVSILPNLITRMAAPVHINGQGPFQFVVDTGAGRTSLSDVLAQRLQLEAGPLVMVHGVVGPQLTPTVQIPHMDFAEERIESLSTPVFPRARLGVDGLLGLDVIGERRLVFDIEEERIHVTRSGTRGYRRGDMRGLRDHRSAVLRGTKHFGGLTLVQAQAERVRMTALLDTGAQYSVGNLALYQSLAVRRRSVRERALPTPVFGVTGQTAYGELAVLRELRLGSARITDMPVVFADLHVFDIWNLRQTPALIMGADLMGLFGRVIVDFGRAEMVFHLPSSDETIINFGPA